MMPPRNILAVIGTTGVGKSQYAVSLAKSTTLQHANIRPTVLSSDSMQLYEGLPVITNKVTEEDMAGVEHWGLGVVKPGEGGSWEVGKWCVEAWDKVSCYVSARRDRGVRMLRSRRDDTKGRRRKRSAGM